MHQMPDPCEYKGGANNELRNAAVMAYGLNESREADSGKQHSG